MTLRRFKDRIMRGLQETGPIGGGQRRKDKKLPIPGIEVSFQTISEAWPDAERQKSPSARSTPRILAKEFFGGLRGLGGDR
jgi:hypothetical protein